MERFFPDSEFAETLQGRNLGTEYYCLGEALLNTGILRFCQFLLQL